jgi:hypothetical protein
MSTLESRRLVVRPQRVPDGSCSDDERHGTESSATALRNSFPHRVRDHGISGAKGRDKPAFYALCRDASRHQFDVVKMKLPRRRFLHLAAGAAPLPGVAGSAFAQAYPTRPVRTTAPGGAPATNPARAL